MKELIKQIEIIRSKLDSWRRLSMKEAQTRATIIDPLLEALGWDVRDPDEVELEYATVDGKAVDYGLKINRKPVLLIEAKPLNDPLDDVKAVTQVVGYAANAGIASCILTNGAKWRVYRSMEKCEARDKLMFEVSLDPRESEGLSAQQVGEQMWRFSQDEMAKGTLDALGEQTFTDGKVRKALNGLMQNPPRPLLNIIRRSVGDEALTPHKIRESLRRFSGSAGEEPFQEVSATIRATMSDRSKAAQKAGKTKRSARKEAVGYDESIHTAGRPKEVLEMFRTIDRYCFSLAPDVVEKKCRFRYINYVYGKAIFCSVIIWQNKLGVYLSLKYDRLANAPHFARDVSNVGHWGIGDVELAISSLSQLSQAKELIRQSFESAA